MKYGCLRFHRPSGKYKGFLDGELISINILLILVLKLIFMSSNFKIFPKCIYIFRFLKLYLKIRRLCHLPDTEKAFKKNFKIFPRFLKRYLKIRHLCHLIDPEDNGSAFSGNETIPHCTLTSHSRSQGYTYTYFSLN
jgi:hypothetical protein